MAATTGDLRSALTSSPVDDELLDGAGDILTALCHGGPARDITDYPAAPGTIERYLALIAQRPPNPDRAAVVLRLAQFIASDRAVEPDWPDATRTRLRRTCDALVSRPEWPRAVDRAMDDPDLFRFRLAIWPARHLGVPTRARIRARLRHHPDDGYLWQALIDDTDDIDGADGIDDVLALAHELLPLEHLATRSTLDTGLGAGRAHHVLDLIVSRLDAHPGKGWPLIEVALANPTIRNRNMAVRALSA